MLWRGLPGIVAVLALIGSLFGTAMAVRAQDDGTATITVHLRLCDEVAPDGNYYPSCHESPYPDALVTAFTDGEGVGVVEGTTDANGNVDLAVAPATYYLSGPPGGSFDSLIVCSPTDTPGSPIPYPVTLAAGDAVVCDYYIVPASAAGPEGELPLGEGFSIGAINCESDPGGYNPRSAKPLPEGCEPAVGVVVTVAASDGTVIASCTTRAIGGCNVETPNAGDDVVVTEDVATLPQGYAPKENPIVTQDYTEFRGAFFINVRQSDEGGQEGEAEQASDATEPPTDESDPDARPAAIHVGTCDEPGDAVADLTGVSTPDGESSGAAEALPVENSFTRLNLSLDDILAIDHVVAVLAGADDDELVACGAVGGVLTEDGSLAVGLHEADGSGLSGIAYLAPDGDQTQVTVFLAGDLSGPEGTPAAS